MKREREKKNITHSTRKEKRSYLSVKVYIIRWTSTISSVPNFTIFLFLSLRIVFLPVHDSSWNKALGVSAPPWKEKPWFYFWTEVSPTRLPEEGGEEGSTKGWSQARWMNGPLTSRPTGFPSLVAPGKRRKKRTRGRNFFKVIIINAFLLLLLTLYSLA